MRHLVQIEGRNDQFSLDSAGMGDWHIGRPPDRRAQATALRNGFDISDLRARQFEIEDFSRFQLILAMDQSNLRSLNRLAPARSEANVALFLDFAGDAETRFGTREVPDPYGGSMADFEYAVTLIEAAGRGLLESVGHTGPDRGEAKTPGWRSGRRQI